VGTKDGLGRSIANLRRARGLTQDELSNKAGISYSTLAKLERGAISSPSVFTVLDIAKVLGVTVDEILHPSKVVSAGVDSSNKIKFVYCDVNGVLVRFFHKAFGVISKETGVNVDKIETAFWHYNDAANRGEITTEEFNRAIEIKLGLKSGSINWEQHYMSCVEPIESMHKCLTEIAKTTKVGLLSDNFPGFLKIMISKKLLPDIEYSSIIESASVHSKKPDQRIYEIAEERAKTPGSDIFFIDDSRANLSEAEKRGWRVLWFDDYNPEDSVKRVQQAISAS